MQIERFDIEGLALLTPKVHEDSRGYFYESFNEKALINLGINFHAVQDNQAKSGQNILRGLHYQIGSMAQAKLIRVLQGKILDVAVDLRTDSPTYGQYIAVELDAKDRKQFFVPKGFAHGYLSLSAETTVFYKCDQYYSPEHEGGIRYDDPTINIDWGTKMSLCTISKKDLAQPYLGQHKIISSDIK